MTMDDRESLIEELIEHFNFERVHIAMTTLDWRWASPNGGLTRSVPTITRLKDTARILLRTSINDKVISSGGFEAKYHPAIDGEPEFFELRFILCSDF